MKIAYVAKEFRGATLEMIRTADAICRSYAHQGYDLTLRQLYYQHEVADRWTDIMDRWTDVEEVLNS